MKWPQHSLSSPSSLPSFTAKPGKIKSPFLSLPYSCFWMQISFYQLDVLSWDLKGRRDLRVIFLGMLWLLLPESSLKDCIFMHQHSSVLSLSWYSEAIVFVMEDALSHGCPATWVMGWKVAAINGGFPSLQVPAIPWVFALNSSSGRVPSPSFPGVSKGSMSSGRWVLRCYSEFPFCRLGLEHIPLSPANIHMKKKFPLH